MTHMLITWNVVIISQHTCTFLKLNKYWICRNGKQGAGRYGSWNVELNEKLRLQNIQYLLFTLSACGFQQNASIFHWDVGEAANQTPISCNLCSEGRTQGGDRPAHGLLGGRAGEGAGSLHCSPCFWGTSLTVFPKPAHQKLNFKNS